MKRIVGIRTLKPAVVEQWRQVYDGIKTLTETVTLPQTGGGCSGQAAEDVNSTTFRFQTLVGLMVSAQTKDVMTYQVMTRLKEHGCSVQSIVDTAQETLAGLLYGASFHNTKAKNIKKVAEILQDQYSGDVPTTYREIMALPGVGPKMTLLYIEHCLGRIEGISVDTHVHRISNRLGWVNSKTPEQTRKQLEAFLPKELWGEVNRLLVQLGQTICRPVGPKCNECSVQQLCPTGKEQTPLKKRKSSSTQSSR